MPLVAMSDHVDQMQVARLRGLGYDRYATTFDTGVEIVDLDEREMVIGPRKDTPQQQQAELDAFLKRKQAERIQQQKPSEGRSVWDTFVAAKDAAVSYITPSPQPAPRQTNEVYTADELEMLRPPEKKIQTNADAVRKKAAPKGANATIDDAMKSLTSTAVSVAPIFSRRSKTKKKPPSNTMTYVLVGGGILIGGVILYSMFKGK